MTPAERYSDYLKSDYWQAVTKAVKARADYRCVICDSPHDLQAHHRNYKNRGNELEHLNDLTCLCRRCHAIFHGKEELTRKETKVIHVHTTVDFAAIDREIPDGVYFSLTRDLVMRCRTPRGGFTTATLKALGVAGKNCSGWIDRLAGKRIHRDEYRRAIEGRYQAKGSVTY